MDPKIWNYKIHFLHFHLCILRTNSMNLLKILLSHLDIIINQNILNKNQIQNRLSIVPYFNKTLFKKNNWKNFNNLKKEKFQRKNFLNIWINTIRNRIFFRLLQIIALKVKRNLVILISSINKIVIFFEIKIIIFLLIYFAY